jgi:hypothetical protein
VLRASIFDECASIGQPIKGGFDRHMDYCAKLLFRVAGEENASAAAGCRFDSGLELVSLQG